MRTSLSCLRRNSTLVLNRVPYGAVDSGKTVAVASRWVKLAARLVLTIEHRWLAAEWKEAGRLLQILKRTWPQHPRRRRYQRQWSLVGSRLNTNKHQTLRALGQ